MFTIFCAHFQLASDTRSAISVNITTYTLICRSSHRGFSAKKGVLKSFANFTRKHLCWSLFSKVAGLKACEFIKRRLQHRCFPMKFTKFLRTPILKTICGRLLLDLEKKVSVLITTARSTSAIFQNYYFLLQRYNLFLL